MSALYTVWALISFLNKYLSVLTGQWQMYPCLFTAASNHIHEGKKDDL